MARDKRFDVIENLLARASENGGASSTQFLIQAMRIQTELLESMYQQPGKKDE